MSHVTNFRPAGFSDDEEYSDLSEDDWFFHDVQVSYHSILG